jgi:hypothetical protein
MVGRHVQYKKGKDKKEYIVVGYSGIQENALEEICIIQELPYYSNRIRQEKIWHLPYYSNRIRQEKIWQNLNKFIIIY